MKNKANISFIEHINIMTVFFIVLHTCTVSLNFFSESHLFLESIPKFRICFFGSHILSDQ